jgi:hypothetical protein
MATVEFIRVMELCVDYSLDEVAAAVEQAMTSGSLGVSTVVFLLRTSRTPSNPFSLPILDSAPACPTVQDRDLRQYDCLIRR